LSDCRLKLRTAGKAQRVCHLNSLTPWEKTLLSAGQRGGRGQRLDAAARFKPAAAADAATAATVAAAAGAAELRIRPKSKRPICTAVTYAEIESDMIQSTGHNSDRWGAEE